MITEIPIEKLVLSKLNVRQIVNDGGTADLEASIMSHGLLSALVVHTIIATPKAKALYGVLAGGRRLRAMQALLKRGDLPKGHLVPCDVRDEAAEAQIEISVIENTARVALTPVEEFTAFARLSEEDPDMDAAAIAKRFGTTTLHVQQRMRLGQLHPNVLAALGTGKITLDAAKAYAATSDHAIQLRVFDYQETLSYGRHSAYNVRQLILRGDSAYDLPKMLGYVGRDAYVAAGGIVEEDLFGDGLRVAHAGLLSELYYAKLEEEKAALAATLPADAEIVTEVGDGSWRRLVEAKPKLTAEQEARRTAIDARCEEISAKVDAIAEPPADDSDDAVLRLVASDPKNQAEVDALLAEMDALEDESEGILAAAPVALPDGPLLAKIETGSNGLRVTGYYRPDGWSPDGATDTTSAVPATPTVRETHGLSDTAVEILSAQRRAVLRAQIARWDTGGQHPAADYLTFSILRLTLQDRSAHDDYVYFNQLGLADSVRAGGDSAIARPFVECSQADELYTTALREIFDAEWMRGKDLLVAFSVFLDLDLNERQHLAGVAAAQLLGTSLTVPGRAAPALDQLAYAMGVEDGEDTRSVWTPDLVFFSRLPKEHRLAAVREISPRLADKIKGLPAASMADACARIMAAEPDAVREYDMLPGQVRHARRWVPAAMAFDDTERGPRILENTLDAQAAATPRADLDRKAAA